MHVRGNTDAPATALGRRMGENGDVGRIQRHLRGAGEARTVVRSRRVLAIGVALAILVAGTWNSGGGNGADRRLPTSDRVVAPSLTGVADDAEPSGMSPPLASALPGFTLHYVNNFSGSTVPDGWDVYGGVPGGDLGGQFGPGHVSVADGTLQLSTWPDPAYGGEWVTGGLCQCGLAQTYGAYFVRSRVTGPGPTGVELLWPVDNSWPPEIDFNETDGNTTQSTATIHWSPSNHVQQGRVSVDMTAWHTWGVVWTPGQVLYLVDGKVWSTVSRPNEIPSVPMTLDLQQQTWCLSAWACPLSPQEMVVDWVAEYSLTGPVSVVVGPFAARGYAISTTSGQEVGALAADVVQQDCSAVSLVGYAKPTKKLPNARAHSLNLARTVAVRLKAELAVLGVGHVTVDAQGAGAASRASAGARLSASSLYPDVVGTACASR